jgi:hypothetical protein
MADRYATEHSVNVEIFGMNCLAYFTVTTGGNAYLDRIEVGLHNPKLNDKWECYCDLDIDGAAIREPDGCMTPLRDWLNEKAEKNGWAQDWCDDDRIFA